MAATRWKLLADAEPEREYLALLSYLPVKRYRTIPRFLEYTGRIRAQLDESRGVVGYSVRAQILKRDFWTLSVWENESRLMEFVQHGFHSGVMIVLRQDMGATNFVRWKVRGADIPPSWGDALRRWKSQKVTLESRL